MDQQSSLYRSFAFVGTSLIGSLTTALVSVFAPPIAQIGFVGSLVSILVGLFVAREQRERETEKRRDELLEKLQIPFALTYDRGFFEHYSAIANAIADLARQPDPLLQQLAQMKLKALSEEVAGLAKGDITFTATETWRTVYQKLLETLSEKTYHSAAWVRTADYWQDAPGRQSMRLNYELVKRGYRIERIHILPETLWPVTNVRPSETILPWLTEQHGHGIVVALVRESDLANEPDLLLDFAVYNDRATAIQELDEHSRTTRFLLSFDPQKIRQAQDRWERLALYAISLQNVLDQKDQECIE